ncbi:MAG: hypothetical protein M3083_14335 [Actinomycetota bacterium]|nr:hypothetical protein [Actinomycetota bacterium]
MVAAILTAALAVPSAPAMAASNSRPLCTTPASDTANVDTDCLNDGSSTFETALAVNPTNAQNLVGAAIGGQLTAKGNRLQFTGTVRPHVTSMAARPGRPTPSTSTATPTPSTPRWLSTPRALRTWRWPPRGQPVAPTSW